MKKNWKNNWLVVAIITLLTLASCGTGGDHAEHADTYTCPMHPTVISDRPGTCPVCGMDLVRKARAGEEVEITEDLAKLLKSPNETVIASIKTIKAEYKEVPSSVEAQGIVTYDTRNIFTIPSRVGGRLEKVFLKYQFQPVTKGQKIAEIYSPELLTAQRELLFLIDNDAENKSLIDAAKNKLELLGLTSAQVANLVARKTTTQTFSIYSPYSGYLITGQQAPTTSASTSSASSTSSGGMSDGMGASASTSAASATVSSPEQGGSIIREGAYVSAGQTLFSIVNTSDLRIELDLPASQAGEIKKGDKLSLNFGDGSIEETTIDFIQPFFNEGQDFVKLRVFTNKTKDLHIGHLVTAKIQVPASESLWVPRQAVLDIGTDRIVFLKERGVLKPKKVTVGISSGGLVEIKRGLASSDEIAANAQYLIDSESFIKTAK
jgi:Cu(I)/Ag(I) efflux system membrane fusion protein